MSQTNLDEVSNRIFRQPLIKRRGVADYTFVPFPALRALCPREAGPDVASSVVHHDDLRAAARPRGAATALPFSRLFLAPRRIERRCCHRRRRCCFCTPACAAAAFALLLVLLLLKSLFLHGKSALDALATGPYASKIWAAAPRPLAVDLFILTLAVPTDRRNPQDRECTSSFRAAVSSQGVSRCLL